MERNDLRGIGIGDAGPRKRRLCGRFQRPPLAVLALGAIALSSGPFLAAPVSSAATPPTLSLFSGPAKVRTANGHTFYMSLVARTDQTSPTTSVVEGVIEIVRPVTTGGSGYEEHSWGFQATLPTLSFNSANGRGTFNTGTQEHGLASIDVTFKATSHKAAACKSGSETVYTGTLSGKASLVTGITGGGTIGGTSESFAATNILTYDKACVPPSSAAPCISGDGFYSVAGSAGAIGFPTVLSGKSVDQVEVTRVTKLSSPAGAERTDGAVIEGAPATLKSGTLSVTTGTTNSSVVTGSATLTGGHAVSIPKTSCTEGGKTHIQSETLYQNAKYQSTAGHPITAHDLIGSAVVAPSPDPSAIYEVWTVS